jgi:hypothetical protein
MDVLPSFSIAMMRIIKGEKSNFQTKAKSRNPTYTPTPTIYLD